MSTAFAEHKEIVQATYTDTMRATVFHGVDDIRIEEVPRPHAGPGKAVIRVTMTTICGTDLHIVRGEYPVKPSLIIGHEPVGACASARSPEDRPGSWMYHCHIFEHHEAGMMGHFEVVR